MSSVGQTGFEEPGGHVGAERLDVGLSSGLRGDSACWGKGGGGQGPSE